MFLRAVNYATTAAKLCSPKAVHMAKRKLGEYQSQDEKSVVSPPKQQKGNNGPRSGESHSEISSSAGNVRQNSISMAATPSSLPNSLKSVSSRISSGDSLPSISVPSSVTPWSVAGIPARLPDLPAIHDPVLEAAAFTHSAFATNGKTISYERLEWVGDAYLYLLSTLLISKTFHKHTPGKCAQIRELLVKNETLANYAHQYNFESRAKLPTEFRMGQSHGRATEKERTKVLGDIFEAYVAAVVLSDPGHGVDRVSQWLKDIWSMDIKERIIKQEEENKEESMGILDPDPKVTLQKALLTRGVKLHYRDSGPTTKDPATGFLIFHVGVYLDGWGENSKELGRGAAPGKKEAGANAAREALKNTDLLEVYRGKKKAMEVEIQAERQAAERLEAEAVAAKEPWA